MNRLWLSLGFSLGFLGVGFLGLYGAGRAVSAWWDRLVTGETRRHGL